MRTHPLSSGNSRLYTVLYGAQCHLYYLSLSVKPSKSISLYDENLRHIRSIDVKDVVSFQRRIEVASQNSSGDPASQKDVFEIHLSSDGTVTLQFTIPTTQECEDLCSHIQLQFGMPVYSYGSLNLNFRSALDANNARKPPADTVARGISKKYELVRDDYYASCVAEVFQNLGIAPTDFEHERHEPPAQPNPNYPIIIEGALEEGSYTSYRSVKTPQTPPFSVYKVEWFLSKHRGSSAEFQDAPSCQGDTFFLRDYMVGHYVHLKVYKAIGNDANRTYIFSTATKGPIRLCSMMARNVLLNVSKDNDVHNVLVRAADFKMIARQLNKLPQEAAEVPVKAITPVRPPKAASHVPNLLHNENERVTGKPSDPVNDADGDIHRTLSFPDSTRPVGSCANDTNGTEERTLPTRNKSDQITEVHSEESVPTHVDDTRNTGDDAVKTRPTKGPNPKSKRPVPNAKAPTAPSDDKAANGRTVHFGGASTVGEEPKGLRNIFRNMFKKNVAPNAAPAPKKSALPSPKAKAKSPNPRKSPKATPKSANFLAPLEAHIEICLQNQCRGVRLWTDELELELQWNNLEIQDCNGVRGEDAPSDPQPSEYILSLAYKCKIANEERVLPLTLQLSSSTHRNILYHSMIFNKYRRHFYTIDQGERDLQRGLYSDVKEAYVKIWKHIAQRRTAV
ncbi:hypothetical protein X943_001641 [Babesia divergens]|uniref:Uncharacterized protein n=1 Tax=Babesia divergens TaxID=32595 RepID=A0AAD9LFT8_BABDI|nr:hypothetical protein X943_001641 [Babesia divergens]